MTPKDSDEIQFFPSDKAYYESLTTEQLGNELSTVPLVPPHLMADSDLNEHFDSLLTMESEIHSRMNTIRNANSNVEQNPYLATVSPLVNDPGLREEFSELRNLDAQIGNLRGMYSNEIMRRAFEEFEKLGHEAFKARVEAPLLERIEQLEQRHTELQETTTGIIQTSEQAIEAIKEVQADTGQTTSTDWRQSSNQIAQRLRTYNTRGFEQLTPAQQMELGRIQERSPLNISDPSTPASFSQRETNTMTTEKAPTRTFAEEITSSAPIMGRLIQNATSNAAKAVSQVKEIGATNHTMKP